MDEVTQDFTIINTTNLNLGNYWYPAQDGHANCPGSCWGQFRIIDSDFPGTPPYTYSEPVLGIDIYGFPYFQVPGGACGGTTYQVTVTDALGCQGVVQVIIAEPQLGQPPMTANNAYGACTGENNGSVTIQNVYDGNFFDAPYLNILNAQEQVINTIYNPGNSETIAGLAPGVYSAKRDWNGPGPYTAYPCFETPAIFTIPDLGPTCGTLSGKVFIDNSQDCVQDVGEVGVPYLVLEVLPGPHYALTNSNGHFAIALADGSYTLDQPTSSLVPICPVSLPTPFTMNTTPVVIDIADSSSQELDLFIYGGGSPAHPGFATTHWFLVGNASPQVSGPVTVKEVLDPSLTYTGANPAPDNIDGDTLFWYLPSFSAYEQMTVQVFLSVPVGTPLGATLESTVIASNTLSEILGNNSMLIQQLVTGSFDPNDKQAFTSSRYSAEEYYLGTDEWIDYLIRFQNTGTDTAFNVVVTDTLDADLDITTFQQGVASHPFEVEFLEGRVVQWTFANILLPDSNINEPASHGLVAFRIRPVLPLLPGTEMSNAADIYFDFNEPVHTNDAVLTATMSTGLVGVTGSSMELIPNPTHGLLTIRVDGAVPVTMLTVHDVSGRQVRSVPSVPGSTITLDLGDLPSGVYAVRALCADGTVLRGQVVKV